MTTSNTDSYNGDLSHLLIWFNAPAKPNALWQIHKLWSATASRPIVGYPSFPSIWPFQTTGQADQWIYVTSRLPRHPSILYTLLWRDAILLESLLLRNLKYCSDMLGHLTMPWQSFYKHILEVLAPIYINLWRPRITNHSRPVLLLLEIWQLGRWITFHSNQLMTSRKGHNRQDCR